MTTLLQDIDQSKVKQAFAEHDRRMKMFRKSHPSPLRVKLSRRDLICKLWPLIVVSTPKETGGARLQNSPAGWAAYPSLSILTLHIIHPDYGQLN